MTRRVHNDTMADSYSPHSPDAPLREAPQRTGNDRGATREDMWRPVTDTKDFLGTVAGGAGFVGSNLIKSLLKITNKKIISLDNYSSG